MLDKLKADFDDIIALVNKAPQPEIYLAIPDAEDVIMGLAELLRQILRDRPEGIRRSSLRDVIKAEHPSFYGTESHRRNVEKDHYQSLDYALLAQLYVAVSWRRTL